MKCVVCGGMIHPEHKPVEWGKHMAHKVCFTTLDNKTLLTLLEGYEKKKVMK